MHKDTQRIIISIDKLITSSDFVVKFIIDNTEIKTNFSMPLNAAATLQLDESLLKQIDSTALNGVERSVISLNLENVSITRGTHTSNVGINCTALIITENIAYCSFVSPITTDFIFNSLSSVKTSVATTIDTVPKSLTLFDFKKITDHVIKASIK